MCSSKKQVLIITTVSGFVPQFEMNNVKILQSMGYEVHYASNYNMPVYTDNNDRLNNTGIIRHQIDFVRSPFSIKNIKAYKQLKMLVKAEKFQLIHCHTPMGGVLGRIVATKDKNIKVVYTAHGFHFFKGASIVNWVSFYPVERILARVTDVLITINLEDYQNAKAFKLKNNGTVKMISGIGIDTYTDYLEEDLSKESVLHLEKNQFVLTSVGELSKRKNHQVIIKSLATFIKQRRDIVYVICGSGSEEKNLKELAHRLHVEDYVIFMGYCNDIRKILKVTDCFVMPSLQEGLPVAVLEAMNEGLPVVGSYIRGNKDLIIDGKGGYLVKNQSIEDYTQCIMNLVDNKEMRRNFGDFNRKRIKLYDQKNVIESMKKIYTLLLT